MGYDFAETESPKSRKTFWGEEEQRNERSFRACTETSDMKFATTRAKQRRGETPLALLCSYPSALAGAKRFFKSFRPNKSENNHHTKEVIWNTSLIPCLKVSKKNEKETEQLDHKIIRLENRQKYYEDGERKRRTHRLCIIAGTLESIALARQFITGHFVSRGMVVDFAVHEPEREEGGISNPHFRFLCLIRPIEQNGKWGLKQKREYVLDENGNRISDGNGDYAFNAVYVHTADTECRM